ncbi:hypothetical protein BABINDRAFT_43188 [Babjeviella inositovora NRRL Y-12698]|uniref:Trafficking protein particle complex subunit 6B n=1 Tax=Babjeviella inositovora NRRL Y-12698 TaxID=984486 RepID=A0A1E3QXU4_9ASCO|nr:uncharacterized protein BABINDRAFT_43188 [Babjeviella inositovora NRRL Y-12698]ODQ82431.1 hypothetical protein BABINDRAFT_43188 [Babjeviella inositovora NRRL Y-12698]
MNTVESQQQPAQVNSACLDFLLMEIVPLSIRVSQTIERENKDKLRLKLEDLSLEPGTTHTNDPSVNELLFQNKDDLPGTVKILEDELIRSEDVHFRIESYGFSLGLRISELLLSQEQQTAHKLVELLDVMKFVCRDVWKNLYGKQMDNLRTNHRGTFVLVDNSLKLISRMSSSKGMTDTIGKAQPYLWFPCGIIKGILASLGIPASVTAEITQFPSVSFSIQTSIES